MYVQFSFCSNANCSHYRTRSNLMLKGSRATWPRNHSWRAPYSRNNVSYRVYLLSLTNINIDTKEIDSLWSGATLIAASIYSMKRCLNFRTELTQPSFQSALGHPWINSNLGGIVPERLGHAPKSRIWLLPRTYFGIAPAQVPQLILSHPWRHTKSPFRPPRACIHSLCLPQKPLSATFLDGIFRS